VANAILSEPAQSGALLLRDRSRYEGTSFGAHSSMRGEVVFNTGMTGYVEALTDPSYRGQILVLTYPLQGNYGVPTGPWESRKVQVQGLVCSHYTASENHRRSKMSLGAWLASQGVPALCGVDTRTLTRKLREYGTMEGALLHAGNTLDALPLIDMQQAAQAVTEPGITREGPSEKRVLLIDTGAKHSISEALIGAGLGVVRVPFYERWEELLPEVQGVMLSNGPGDPTDLMPLVLRIRALLERPIPIFGICLGHQLLALAAGASTYKLPYGHRSQNQPVMDLALRRTYITSQNHGYAVQENSLPRGWEPWFVNLNDDTNEGIRHSYRPLRSVQFHPEAAAGPHDTGYLFADFAALVGELSLVRRV
jgi:carbamoyl-phosphate synthase small subunit